MARPKARYFEIWDPLVGHPAAVASWKFSMHQLQIVPVTVGGFVVAGVGFRNHVVVVTVLGYAILVGGTLGLYVASRRARSRYRKLLAEHYGIEGRLGELPPNNPMRFDEWRRKWVPDATSSEQS